MTDCDGNMSWAAKHKAWGAAKVAISDAAEAAGIKNPFRLQGQYFDEESGLHYNRYRYYDPHSGRFVSKDPTGFDGGNNFHQYAPNPIEWVDPFGLQRRGGGQKVSGAKPALPGDPYHPNEVEKRTGKPINSIGNPHQSVVCPLPVTHQEQAEALCYKKTNYRSHGMVVYMNPKAPGNIKFITPDIDQHNGGYWKGADSVRNLGSRNNRSGTYDAKLNRIGD
jgi:RHS repeat-associated protein